MRKVGCTGEAAAISPARMRVLRMLDQQGPLHRHEIGFAFSKRGRLGMWTQAATRLAGYLCRPLLDTRLIEERCDRDGFHVHMAITKAGRERVRAAPPPTPSGRGGHG